MTAKESERLAVVETNIDHIKQSVDKIEKALLKNTEAEAELDKKFASKWVEKFVYGIIVLLIGLGVGIIKSCT